MNRRLFRGLTLLLSVPALCQETKPPAFLYVDVHPSAPNAEMVGGRFRAGSRFEASGYTMLELISRAYNLLLRIVLAARFSDAQCGFKAGRTEVIKALLPSVQDDAWFFDTELLMLAQRRKLRIWEIPITWIEDPDSTVDIVRAALADLRGVARLRFASRGTRRRSRGLRSRLPDGNRPDARTACRSAEKELATPEQH